MDTQAVSYIAVDVAKDTLRVQTTRIAFDVPNTEAGIGALLRRTRTLKNRHFVCEASGGYERILVDTLHEKGRTVSLVSAARVRDFARSEGTKAKTDPIDARVILRFAGERHPDPTPPPSPQRKRLMALVDRREQLTEQLKREKTRMQKPGCDKEIAASVRCMIRVLEREIKKLDTSIKELVRTHESMKNAYAVLTSIKGIGPINAWTIIAHLPEITSTSRAEIAALAGLAPFNRDSGNKIGLRRIFGGRAKVRRCLYMAATAAAEHNEVIRAYVNQLKARGKPYKWAIVAAMRKMLIHAQRQLKNHEISLA